MCTVCALLLYSDVLCACCKNRRQKRDEFQFDAFSGFRIKHTQARTHTHSHNHFTYWYNTYGYKYRCRRFQFKYFFFHVHIIIYTDKRVFVFIRSLQFLPIYVIHVRVFACKHIHLSAAQFCTFLNRKRGVCGCVCVLRA